VYVFMTLNNKERGKKYIYITVPAKNRGSDGDGFHIRDGRGTAEDARVGRERRFQAGLTGLASRSA
jgi:hypothetical protein